MGILRKELGDHLQVVLADFVAMFVWVGLVYPSLYTIGEVSD